MLSCTVRALGRTALVAVAATLVSTSAHALPVSFTRVVDTSDPIPGTAESFNSVGGRPALEGNRTAFVGSNSAGVQALYVHEAGTNTLVAGTSTPVPGGTGNFGNGYSHLSADGAATAFRAQASSGQTGAYLDTGSGLVSIADFNTLKPGDTAPFQQIAGLSVSGNEVAFFGSKDPMHLLNSGIYRGSGGALSVIADGSTIIPGDGRNFEAFRAITRSDGDDVAFIGGVTGSLGVMLWNGTTLLDVADRLDTAPGTTAQFDGFLDVSLDDGAVSFLGAITGAQGLYTHIASVTSLVVDTTTAIPDGTGTFNQTPNHVLSDGKLVFVGVGDSSQRGIYTNFGGSLEKIIDRSDTLDGKAISNLQIGPEAFEGNRLVFEAEFADGSRGIYIATIPEPATAMLLGGGLAVLAARRRTRP